MRPHPHLGSRRGTPRRCALAHYELGLVIAAPEARLVRGPCGSAHGKRRRVETDEPTPLTRYGLVVQHYLHQLPHKVPDLELLALQMLPEAVRLVVRLRLPPDPPPPPDPAVLRDAIRWLKTMTLGAHLRGAARGRWQTTSSPVWTRGFARRLLRSPTEVARALSACGRSSA